MPSEQARPKSLFPVQRQPGKAFDSIVQIPLVISTSPFSTLPAAPKISAPDLYSSNSYFVSQLSDSEFEPIYASTLEDTEIKLFNRMSSRGPRLFTKDDAIDLINANDSDVSDLDEGTDDEYQLSENESGDELSSSSEDDDVSDTVSATAASTSAAPESNRRLWKKGIFTAADAPFTGAAYQPPDNATEKSPLDYLLDFLKDDMIENACEQTNLYTTHKLGRTINLGAQEFLKAIGIFFQMGVVKVTGKRFYWETETRYSQVADAMPKNRFCQIVSSLHFTETRPMTTTWKPTNAGRYVPG
ncbi:PiggyBac transposable element-derived 3-like protein [Plakobranchus ocellatus]|uniref:PiggyBac transposable element-derived 3-like protein n=1 Tax=Plakobranchus ocellatus TaxID=259542 RepID=A0AAV3Z834_9GAST|nr:PiggyBac transposable element-derived 3-like protein [Plakobranchus ocellatus]